MKPSSWTVDPFGTLVHKTAIARSRLETERGPGISSQTALVGLGKGESVGRVTEVSPF
jgi:hypothetical protein